MKLGVAFAIVAACGCGKRDGERQANTTSPIAAGVSVFPPIAAPQPLDVPLGSPGHPANSSVLPIKIGPVAVNATLSSFAGTPTRFTWRGAFGGHGKVLVSGKGGQLVGTIFDGTKTFRIERGPMGGAIVRAIPRRKDSIDRPDPSPLKHGPKLAIETQQGNVRVLAAYTAAAAADKHCGDIELAIDHAIALTNLVAENTEVTPRFELAGDPYMTTFKETNQSIANVVEAFRKDADMKSRRRAREADIVILFVSSNDLMTLGASAQTTADYGTAVAAVNCRQVNDYFVVPHEIGHLFGLNDDDDVPTPTTLEYGYGSAHDDLDPDRCWRTIMSQAVDCKCDCPLIPYWSNPAVEVDGIPTGNKLQSDNARAIEDSAGAITRFEPKGPPP